MVVGAGLAGFFAALSAGRSGAKVALVEKQGVMGTTVFASGIMYVAQDADGVDAMYDKWIENAVTTCEYPTADRVRALCEVSPGVLGMLDDLGVRYTIGKTGNLVPVSSTRMLRNNVPIKLGTAAPLAKGSEALMRALQAACPDNGVDLYVWIMDDLLSYTENGMHNVQAYKADTIEELAEKIGVDAGVLSESLDSYNAACEAGEDADFGKDPQYLVAMENGPFYVVLAYSIIRAIAGGMKTDGDFAVVREDGTEIPGLYAAGIASSREFWGDYYPGAQAITLCTHGGYVAGRNAAEHALGK